MTTSSPDLGETVDLDLVAEDDEPCYGDDRQATGYIEYSDLCACHPNPAPLCELHFQMAKKFLDKFGPEDWVCHICGHSATLVDLRRTR